jgi:hypothetical protein
MGSASGGSPGDLTLRTVDGAGVATQGTASIEPGTGAALRNTVAPYPGNITIDGFTVKSPDVEGIGLQVDGTLVLAGVVSDGNGGSGLIITVQNGDFVVTDSSFSKNLNANGMSIRAHAVTFERVSVDGNNGWGASMLVTGAVRIADSSFSNNTGFGVQFAMATDAILSGIVADGNRLSNASFALSRLLDLTDSSFSNSETSFGLSVTGASDATLTGVTVDGNKDSGASLAGMEALRIVRSSFSRNVADGLMFEQPGRATLLSVVIEGNEGTGLFALLHSGLISGSRFANNGTGLALNLVEPSEALRLHCNDILGNVAGLRLVDGVTVDAVRNYWGAPSGPNHPSNPAGTGNSIDDAANGAAGTVIFRPFLIAPSAESAVCQPRGAPALGWRALAVLLLGLFVLPAWRLARREARSRPSTS